MPTISIEQIIAGTETGRRQSVGYMDIIPLLGDDDDSFSPPSVDMHTSGYGTVNLRNNGDQPTIIPTGSGWVVSQAAQDHAVGTAIIIPSKAEAKIRTAMCIQSTQGGLISKDAHNFVVLPTRLRNEALATRHNTSYDRLWKHIEKFNGSYGISPTGHLDHFLNHFRKELDEFVAEFELVPNQVGAIVVIGDQIVGVERSPSPEFWAVLWTPLIRVCYGSIAIKLAKGRNMMPSKTRVTLASVIDKLKTLDDIDTALKETVTRSEATTTKIINSARKSNLKFENAEMSLDGNSLFTAANDKYAGQYVINSNTDVKYASLFARVV